MVPCYLSWLFASLLSHLVVWFYLRWLCCSLLPPLAVGSLLPLLVVWFLATSPGCLVSCYLTWLCGSLLPWLVLWFLATYLLAFTTSVLSFQINGPCHSLWSRFPSMENSSLLNKLVGRIKFVIKETSRTHYSTAHAKQETATCTNTMFYDIKGLYISLSC